MSTALVRNPGHFSIRAADVSSVRGSLQSSTIYIKPIIAHEGKVVPGVPRSVIRIRGSRLFVRNKIHSQIKLSGSIPYYNTSSDVHNSASPIVDTQPLTMPPPHPDNTPIVLNNVSHATETPQNQQHHNLPLTISGY